MFFNVFDWKVFWLFLFMVNSVLVLQKFIPNHYVAVFKGIMDGVLTLRHVLCCKHEL